MDLLLVARDQKNSSSRDGPFPNECGRSRVRWGSELELRDHAGALITMNDNWKDTQQAAHHETWTPPHNDHEAAIAVTLSPGAYTAIERGKTNTTGIGLVEMYDLDPTALAKLTNISTALSSDWQRRRHRRIHSRQW